MFEIGIGFANLYIGMNLGGLPPEVSATPSGVTSSAEREIVGNLCL